jgi:hypothetical protein
MKPNMAEMQINLNMNQKCDEFIVNNNNDNNNNNNNGNKCEQNFEMNNESININENSLSKRIQQKSDNNLVEVKRKSLRQQTIINSEKRVSNEMKKDIELTKLRKENQKLRKTCELLLKENQLLRKELTKNGLNSSKILFESNSEPFCDNLLNESTINDKNDNKLMTDFIERNTFTKYTNEFVPNIQQLIDNKSESFAVNSFEELIDYQEVIQNKNENKLKLNNGYFH